MFQDFIEIFEHDALEGVLDAPKTDKKRIQ